MFDWLKLLWQTESKDANAKQIAKHLAQALLYDNFDIDKLYPDVKEKAQQLQKNMQTLAMPIVFDNSFRSAKTQDNLYAQGRTAPGAIVTNAQGLQSYHQYGLAFDCKFRDWGWNPPDASWWQTLGKEGEKLSLIWGGRWKMSDIGHFEWHPGFEWEELEKYFKRPT